MEASYGSAGRACSLTKFWDNFIYACINWLNSSLVNGRAEVRIRPGAGTSFSKFVIAEPGVIEASLPYAIDLLSCAIASLRGKSPSSLLGIVKPCEMFF